ncbi:hypothetical protein GCM10009425_35100 [Pseudomonas asuensis]|uniref:Peptidase M48 domain-containing protein n=1 Tax=Pseudomonas asuensis TaxID=1825787 RepID=A0ABQ2GZ78_9PSED|nr:M48 family metallopeptidase [Pseudomonas asuensis]GGM21101.1 hypothetical protein GCM10009425_35100 [Pseudomonas asuensis]
MSHTDLAISGEELNPRAPKDLAVELLQQMGLDAQAAELDSSPKAGTTQTSGPTSSAIPEKLPRSGFSLLQMLHLVLVVTSCAAILLFYMAIVATLGALLLIKLPALDVQSLTSIELPEWGPLAVKSLLAGLGGLILFFTAKPIFSVRRREKSVVTLTPGQEQALWEFVTPLCTAMQVRTPTEIHLNNEVDARVHLASGWKGLVKGDLILTLGLPLAAGFSKQQLAGVLAHELGHCTRRFNMRCYYFINFCNAWLDQRAHFKDALGERLKHLSEAQTSRLTRLSVLIARVGMRLPRQLLHYCFLLSYRLSKPACKRLELDADRYAAQIAGSDTFQSTTLHHHALRWAFRQADRQNVSSWNEGILLADMPQAAAIGATQLDVETQRRLEAKLRDRQRYWRVHPADIERIQAAEALDGTALIKDLSPAATLFEYFPQYCRQVTTAYYQRLGLDVSLTQFREANVAAFDMSQNNETAFLSKWTLGQWADLPWLPLHISVSRETASMDWTTLLTVLKDRTEETGLNWQHAQKEVQRRFTLAYCDELNAHQLTNHIHGVNTFDPERYLSEYRNIDTWQSPARLVMSDVAALFRQRIDLTLKSHHPGHAQARDLAQLLFSLTELYPDYERLREAQLLVKEYNSLHRLQGSMQTHQLSHYALLDFRARAQRLVKQAETIKQHILPGDSIGDYLKQQHPYLEAEAGPLLDFYQKSDALLESFTYCYRHTFNLLAKWCLEAETAKGH